ncbi:hypothetical protein [Synechococcus sp. PCC 7502]|uniref:hypothetical protein n=1 Tax=Synechococcus sp. PCC 7502 TaxID=1173263 RepID=UPI00059BE337|nr:hypothetical protein [Synechococcus sp. PCC 7502]
MAGRSVQLPIRVNDKNIFKNSKEQAYQITDTSISAQDSNFSNNVQIFFVSLGNPPILIVKDEQARKLDSEFLDRSEVSIKGYLTVSEIIESRQYKSRNKIELLYNLDISKLEELLINLRESLRLRNNKLRKIIDDSKRLIHRSM